MALAADNVRSIAEAILRLRRRGVRPGDGSDAGDTLADLLVALTDPATPWPSRWWR